MKRKILSVLLALVLALSLCLVTSVPAAAAGEVWVDASVGMTGDGTSESPFLTIKEGITAVDEGGTVHVAAGTYEESLVINKGLTLVSTEGPENTRIDVPSGTGIEIKASGVTVEGFKVSGDGLHYGIMVRKGVGVEVLNNVVTGTTKQAAILLYEGDLVEITVSGNVIDNCAYGIAVGGGSSFSISGCTISDNTITGSTGGDWGAMPFSGEISDITISGNEISDNEGMNGILLGAGTYENIVVEKNTVSNNLNGVQIKKAGFTNLAINHNNIVDNTEYGIDNLTAVEVDATNNWWGDASGPSGKGPGTGDAVSDNVLYKPWLKAPYRPTTPMPSFIIDHAKIDFKKKVDDDKVRVQGKLELDLDTGDGVDISEDVIVTVGLLSETITMVEMGKKGEKWEYKRPKGTTGDIKHMTINWKNGKFDIRMDKADLSELTDPEVTISIQIGDDVGEKTIQMRVKKHHWDYKAK